MYTSKYKSSTTLQVEFSNIHKILLFVHIKLEREIIVIF